VEAAVDIAGALDFSWLFAPAEQVDEGLTHLLEGAPLLVALGIAFVLGLRHASDPDHLVAVTSLVAADRDGCTRDATRLGAWWGLGHATMLLALGIPLIALHSSLPAWLESAAEKGIGLIIIVLAARVIWKWARGEYRSGRHEHAAAHAPLEPVASGEHRHLRREREREHGHRPLRTPAQAFGIGTLHGLAGTGAVVVLLLSALPSALEAGLALAVFAPTSIVSMAACTTAFAWVLTRPIIEPLYRAVLIPSLGAFGLLFGLWYAGLA
jgi:ABC-type nickel/cobalt efflux system permease component RcnA